MANMIQHVNIADEGNAARRVDAARPADEPGRLPGEHYSTKLGRFTMSSAERAHQ